MKHNLLTMALLASGLTYSIGASAESTLVTVYSQDYESATATDWTSQYGQVSLTTGDETYGNYTNFIANSTSGDRTAYWKAFSGDLTEGYIDAEQTTSGYNIDFDIALAYPYSTSDSREQQFIVMTIDPSTLTVNSAYSGTEYLFSLSQAATRSTTWYINDLTNAGETTTTLESGAWYHVCLNVTTSGVTYTITNSDGTVATGTNATTDGTLPTFVGLFSRAGRSFYPETYGFQKYDNIKVTKYVDGVVANDPTIALSGINGASRTYTITCAEGETIYYKLPEASEYVAGEGTSIQVETSTSGTLYAYTTIGTATSNEVYVTVEAKELTLATPTISRDSYESNVYTVSFTSNQSGIGLNPAATIYYSIDGATAVEGTSATVPEGSTIEVYAVADGYTNSESAIWESKARPTNVETVWTQDYTSVASTVTSEITPQLVTLSSEAAFTVNSTNFYTITSCAAGDVTVTENVGLDDDDYVYLRTHTTAANCGLLVQRGTRYVGIQGLEEGQTIVITTSESLVPAAYNGVTYVDGMSVVGEYYFTATATEASFSIPGATYNYIYTITVLKESTSDSGEATAIEALEAEREADDTIYDLSGRKVVGEPAPGLYIKGGKKYLVR